jgi:hypothetical protein
VVGRIVVTLGTLRVGEERAALEVILTWVKPTQEYHVRSPSKLVMLI